jgi:hypothetical protein
MEPLRRHARRAGVGRRSADLPTTRALGVSDVAWIVGGESEIIDARDSQLDFIAWTARITRERDQIPDLANQGGPNRIADPGVVDR